MVKRREDKELLLVVTMEGYCHVVENMERLLMIDNRQSSSEDNSCWSLDILLQQNQFIVALGSNNTSITVHTYTYKGQSLS